MQMKFSRINKTSFWVEIISSKVFYLLLTLPRSKVFSALSNPVYWNVWILRYIRTYLFWIWRVPRPFEWAPVTVSPRPFEWAHVTVPLWPLSGYNKLKLRPRGGENVQQHPHPRFVSCDHRDVMYILLLLVKVIKVMIRNATIYQWLVSNNKKNMIPCVCLTVSINESRPFLSVWSTFVLMHLWAKDLNAKEVTSLFLLLKDPP